MYTRKQALSWAKQFRTCPPLKVKKDSRHAVQVRRHMAICPFCSTSLKDEKEAFERMSGRLITRLPGDQHHPAPAPGQVRTLDPGLACWRGDYFYSPPEVVVLNVNNDTDYVKVAQIWNDLCLAGPGDLILPDMGGLFVETWNIYNLPKDFLGKCLCALGNDGGDIVLEMDLSPDYLPDWAIKTPLLKYDDPRIYFRGIELSTGHVFSTMRK